ncbi:MAG: hypothetical protein J0L66_07745 [Cytophagales bacterium]|nr:hypothetical protein [Cytophagales bacterium]
MKKILITLLSLVGYVTGFTQCNEYYVMENGTSWAYETYNNKGKLSNRMQQTVKAFEKTATGFVATVNAVTTNEKGKELTKGEFEMSCSGGTFIIDMRKFIPEEQQKMFESYKMTVQSENLELPSKLTVGQTLKNGSVTMTAEGSPLPMKMTVQITERKVVGQETITTPAGTYQCFKLTSKSTVSTQMGVNMTFNFSSTEWLAPKVGMVKTESFDKNGKSSGYTQLASYK